MVHEYFWVTGTHETILHFSDLVSVTLHGDDVQYFDTRWDEVLLSAQDVPSDSIESEQFKTVLALNVQDIEKKNMAPSYQK